MSEHGIDTLSVTAELFDEREEVCVIRHVALYIWMRPIATPDCPLGCSAEQISNLRKSTAPRLARAAHHSIDAGQFYPAVLVYPDISAERQVHLCLHQHLGRDEPYGQ